MKPIIGPINRRSSHRAPGLDGFATTSRCVASSWARGGVRLASSVLWGTQLLPLRSPTGAKVVIDHPKERSSELGSEGDRDGACTVAPSGVGPILTRRWAQPGLYPGAERGNGLVARRADFDQAQLVVDPQRDSCRAWNVRVDQLVHPPGGVGALGRCDGTKPTRRRDVGGECAEASVEPEQRPERSITPMPHRRARGRGR